MPFSFGMKLGPYETLSPLGAGGMGEVMDGKAYTFSFNRILSDLYVVDGLK